MHACMPDNILLTSVFSLSSTPLLAAFPFSLNWDSRVFSKGVRSLKSSHCSLAPRLSRLDLILCLLESHCLYWASVKLSPTIWPSFNWSRKDSAFSLDWASNLLQTNGTGLPSTDLFKSVLCGVFCGGEYKDASNTLLLLRGSLPNMPVPSLYKWEGTRSRCR